MNHRDTTSSLGNLRSSVKWLRSKNSVGPILLSSSMAASLLREIDEKRKNGGIEGWRSNSDIPEEEKEYPNTVGELDGILILEDHRMRDNWEPPQKHNHTLETGFIKGRAS